MHTLNVVDNIIDESQNNEMLTKFLRTLKTFFFFAFAILLEDRNTRNVFTKFVFQTRFLQRNSFDDYTSFAKNIKNANLERRTQRRNTIDFANRFVQHEKKNVVNHTTKAVIDSFLFRNHREQNSRSIVEYHKN